MKGHTNIFQGENNIVQKKLRKLYFTYFLILESLFLFYSYATKIKGQSLDEIEIFNYILNSVFFSFARTPLRLEAQNLYKSPFLFQ